VTPVRATRQYLSKSPRGKLDGRLHVKQSGFAEDATKKQVLDEDLKIRHEVEKRRLVYVIDVRTPQRSRRERRFAAATDGE